MNDDNEKLLLVLGRIDGRIEEMRHHSQETNLRWQRFEERVFEKLDSHDVRIRKVETEAARESGKRGAIAGASTAALVHAVVEAAKRLLT